MCTKWATPTVLSYSHFYFFLQKAQNTKVPVLPTRTANVNKQAKPTASVKPVQMKMLAPKVGSSKFTNLLNEVVCCG